MVRSLASERPAGDAAALFELGGIHDALGLDTESIPFYRAMLESAPSSGDDESALACFFVISLRADNDNS